MKKHISLIAITFLLSNFLALSGMELRQRKLTAVERQQREGSIKELRAQAALATKVKWGLIPVIATTGYTFLTTLNPCCCLMSGIGAFSHGYAMGTEEVSTEQIGKIEAELANDAQLPEDKKT